MSTQPTLEVLAPRDAYRLWAPSYAAETAVTFLEDRLAAAMTPPLAGGTLLDVGCGTGRRARARADAGRAFGADLTLEMLQAGRTPGARPLAVAAADVRALPFASAIADVVWCRLVLGHLPELHAAYAELARVCRPGGAIVVTDFHPEAARSGHTRSFRDSGGTLHLVEHHIHDVPDHSSAAERAGLEIETAVQGRVGPEIREFFEGAGRLDIYEQATGLPLVLALLCRRGV